jgi:hypothetical protein
MRAIGIAIPFIRRRSGAAIDAQAQAHFNRVIADGGLVPSGLSGVNAFFTTVKSIYATADITTAISVGLDAQVLGYKLGAGAGTTLGQAAQKLYSCSGASGDVVQTTAASQPLLLVHIGANYYFGSGVNGNYVSTPDAAANRFLNNIAMWGKIRLQDYNVASTNTLLAKRPFSGNMSYFFGITAGGTLFLRISNDGNQSNANQGATSSVSLTSVATNGQDISVGVFRNSSTGDVIFYYSLDDTNWIQLGVTISTAAVGIFNTNLAVGVGGYSDGVTTITGRIYYMNVSSTWLGTPSVSFNPNQYNAATSQTQWTSSTGEIWSIQTGTATTGYKGQIVTKTIVMSDGVDDSLVSGTLISKSLFSRFCALNVLNLINGRYYIGTNTNSDAHLISPNFPNLQLYNTGTGIGAVNFTGFTSNRLNLYSGNYNQALSKTRVNNANETTGTTGNTASTSLIIFSNSSVRNSNAIITTLIDTISVSNDTQLNNMYNYIRSINGNSF